MLCTCRVLLAAVAVSCTLSRTHAHGPSTQRLDRIKDLMCVLLLSGIQKEDFDSSVLNKLQRYNVNIHDLNNYELLQQCTTFKSLNDKNTTPLTHEVENKSKQEKIYPEKSEPDGDDNYNLRNNNSQGNTLYKNSLEKANSKHVIQYKDGQPELKSILNFWNDIKNNNSIKKHKTQQINETFRTEQKNKRNIADAFNSNESDIIQKLLQNFILKKENKQFDEDITKKIINIDHPYSDFYISNKQNTMINTKDNENYKSPKSFPINFEDTQVEQYSINSKPMKNRIHQKSDSEKYKSINANNLNDIINALQSFKINYPITKKDNYDEYLDGNGKESLRSSEYLDKYTQHKNFFTTETAVTPKITDQTLSQNVIKEIAKSVKELVLRDLRKEIFQTTRTITTTTVTETTTTTKREEPTSIIKKESQIVEKSILNKFMDLFEELKSLNLKSLVISSEARKDYVNREAPTYPAARFTTYKDMDQPNYSIPKAYPKNPQNTFDFFPQEHKYRSNIVPEPVLRIPVKAIPITVQTNNMEIPPLGIPVDNPENPINQNIIVSTTNPHRIGKKNNGFNKIKLPNLRIEDLIHKSPEDRFQAPFPYTNQNSNKFLLNKEHSNYDTIYNERITLPGYKESAHKDDELKHSDVPRFHEQLERGVDYDVPQKEYKNRVDCCDERYAYSKQMVECCQRKIASRQQMSLHDVKKQRSYDDSHFKNFLKSQQKVTDMLERILASRSRARSVEIA